MGRSLLIPHPGVSARSWVKEHRGDADLIVLDPGDAGHQHLARLGLYKGEKLAEWRFYGSLDAQRSPHVLVGALSGMLQSASENVLVQLFPARSSPLMKQLIALVAQLVKPDSIFVTEGADLDLDGFPVGPESVLLDPAFPDTVQHAQRKALWLKLVEKCVPHEVNLRRVSIEGARLGAGHLVDREMLKRVGLNAIHAEVAGGTLLVIAEEEPDDMHVARALDVFHCGRIQFVSPEQYEGLLCSFARQGGEDFGMGFVQQIDFESGIAHIMSDAVPPAPVRILRLGSLRIDQAGRELGEARPWQV